MKNFFIFLFLIVSYIGWGNNSSTIPHKVTQEIRYECENANEVYLVWGVNGWNEAEKNIWPEGTYKKGSLLYTPMKPDKNFHSVKFLLNANTLLDYTFWITKGPRDIPSDIWDVNKAPQKDYHNLALNDNVTIINSQLEIRPKEPLSLLHYAWPLFYGVVFLWIFFYCIKRYKFNALELQPQYSRVLVAAGGVLLFALIMLRSSVTPLSWDLYYHPLRYLSQMFWAGSYDHLYVVCLTAFFLAALWLNKKNARIKRTLVSLFMIIGLFSFVCAILNIKVVETLGRPFNFRWFYYSGFLKSADSKAALLANISPDYILKIILLTITLIAATLIIIYLSEFIFQKIRAKKILLFSFVCLNIGYATIAQRSIADYEWNYDRLANPVVAFLQSVNPFGDKPELYTMDVPDSLKIRAGFKKGNISSNTKFSAKIKNVLMLVLESTPAEYVQPYDNFFKVTPELEKQLPNSIVFENIYAHAPATNKSMVSLLGSVYPWLSYASITQEYPGIEIPTLSSELKEKDYRTAFFNSGDNHFQKAGEFLSRHSFDVIKDCNDLSCDSRFQDNDQRDPLSGINDECTANALLSWIKHDTTKPFFGMMWTYQTHYPYYAYGEEKQFSKYDPVLNRYLNAVHHSDAVLGEIINGLGEAGLLESTLIVVVGDHGEAFGRHDQTTHASKIYEENVHIPCVFIHPSFKAEKRTEIGGSADIAPTIMNILGYTTPTNWQGQSLFARVQNRRSYFFCPWSDYLFGYREGDKKYIYNATKDITEIYDLKIDPFETKNIASEDEISLCHQKLAAWVQSQEKLMSGLIKKENN